MFCSDLNFTMIISDKGLITELRHVCGSLDRVSYQGLDVSKKAEQGFKTRS